MDRCSMCRRCVACPHDQLWLSGKGPATAVILTLDELEVLALGASDPAVRERLLCAIALHDLAREQRIRDDLEAAV